ncbi:sugar-transfer associated ATP-grasp domain-containing protein [Salinicoccus kekensis]|uniref:Putatie polysaccharide biosynthesis protein n=1 Tax=Salinicoccus kekensis TaxID=714307 RepID=A0A285UKR9_9STAP|nr:sugar-transfer associated ATP-grasp domain-containing protein [Salinicoccus kekensis]SOC41206.1 putatie polysaccharide biosynthesis protein [Salinicoccus kekensis]
MVKNQSMYKRLGIKTKSGSFKKWYGAGLLNEVDEKFVAEVKEYWNDKTDRTLDPALHLAFMNLNGKKEPKLLSYGVMNYEVYPVFNDYSVTNFYGDKNIYDRVIQPSNTVVTVLRGIRGKYFDASYNYIDSSEALEILNKTDKDMIIKPSRSNNGSGISKFKIDNNRAYFSDETVSIDDLLNEFGGNFIIQEMLEQHPNMAEPHPDSVNSLRMVTFRWKGEIRYLLAYVRIGSNGDIRDNGDTDTDPRVGVKDNGEFFDFALSHDGKKHFEHPTTGFKFSELKPIPNYDEFIQYVKELHENFLHLDIVSWDIAVGKEGQPVFIEANFAGPIPFYQLVSQKPMFGDLTEEVMEYVQKKRAQRKFKLMSKHEKVQIKREKNRTRKELNDNRRLVAELKEEVNRLTNENLKNEEVNKKKNSKLKQEKQTLAKENRELLKEKTGYEKEYKKMKQSNSWRITAPVRFISSKFKKK